MATETFNASTSWLCPEGVTSVQVECWGGGGKGNSEGQNGAGGGAYARLNSLSVTPGEEYAVNVGAAGVSTNGGNSWFLDSSTVFAEGGFGGSGNVGGRIAQCIGDVVFAGGNGTAGDGGGGGSSAGTAANGTNATGVTGGIAPSGGGNGGNGSQSGAGSAGSAPGGGGGGGWEGFNGGDGAAGRVSITYTVVDPPAAPSNVVAAFNPPDGFTVSWQDNSDNETSFEIERRNITLDTEWFGVDPDGGENDEFYDFGFGYVVGPHELQIRVRAVNAGGESEWVESNVFSIQADEPTIEIFTINESYGQRQGASVKVNRGGQFSVRNDEAEATAFNDILLTRLDDYNYYKPDATGGA